MPQGVIKDISYSAELTRDGQIELTIEIEGVNFVREVIPDGQLAGMMGHREVPHTQTKSFILHPQQAQALIDELQRAVENHRHNQF